MVAEGAYVIVAGRTADTLAKLANELSAAGPGRADHVVLDSRGPASVSAAMQAVAAQLGGLDVLINSGAPPASEVIAGSGQTDEVASVAAAFEAKAMGYLRCARAAIPYLLAEGDGRIVNVCGQHVHLTESMAASVRNVAVAAMSKCLADELAGTGVTVNVVHPGPVQAEASGPPPMQAIAAGPSLGVTSAAAVADLITFLASARGSTISGASIDIGHAVRGVSLF
jgi:NAD(P)-dependent dehydrogenase (short-subunit alcohol dehydrogenase family)